MFVVTQVSPYPDGPAGVHGVLGQVSTAFTELAGLSDLDPRVTDDVSDIEASEIAGGGVLVLFTIGETPWSSRQRAAITETLREGRLSLLGVHSATDACRAWDDYGLLLGARFDGHPWTQDFEVEVTDLTHPATQHLGKSWSWRDEVYLFSGMRADARVLLSVAPGQLDMSAPEARTPECGFPLAWCFTEGRGRVFYTALGHFANAWETPKYMQHVRGGLTWLLDEGG